MSTAAYTVPHCGYCGRPVLNAVYFGNSIFHPECAQSPGIAPSISEHRIRQIVREELARLPKATPPAKD